MIILEEYKLTRTVEYFGLTLNITRKSGWISTDKTGEAWFSEHKPYLTLDCQFDYFWRVTDTLIADVDLEDMDWKDTLREYK